ncbi:MAG: DNA topoisomerase, partial [bacterium]
AEALQKDLLAQHYQVDDVRVEKRTRRPLPPYITSTLQQDASVRLGFAPSRTMMIAQQLYEGIELGDEGPVGLITYMRTDSVRIADEARAQAKEFITEHYGPEFYPEKPNFYKTKKSAQDAHEAIRPTSLQYDPEKSKRYLTKEQFKLYQLIFSRFLASQMAPAQIDQLTVEIAGGKYLFRATSSKTAFEGFLAAYSMTPAENGNGNGDSGETELPHLDKEQKLTCAGVEPTQHFTKPPPRFTEASLVKELESDGIGRPSTYAQILSRLKTRKYVELESRRLQPTDLGKTVNELLITLFPDIFSIQFTADMENELDKIETGEYGWRQVLSDFYRPFAVRLDEVEAKRDEIKKATQKVSEHVCDKCGQPMIEKWGRNGRFLACSGYPECKNTMPLNGEPVQELDEKCELCGAPMVIREGRFGKFIACSAYPECKNTKPIPTGIKCPKDSCDGDVVERRTRRGKTFWGCSRYPDCDFASWAKPVNRACSNCGHSWVQEKETKTHGPHYYCPECRFREPIDQQNQVESAKV